MTGDFHHFNWDEARDWANQNSTIDAKVVDDPRDRPEWAIWELFGSPTKTQDALAYLDYEGEGGGLFHYRDRRFPAEEYTVPTQRTIKIYQLENRLRELKYGTLHDWGFALMGLAGALLVPALITALAKPVLATIALGIPFLVLVIGGAITQFPGKPVLPIFRLFLSDAEHDEAVAEGERRRRAQALLATAALAGWAVHKHHQHERQEMAEAIADAIKHQA